jgi:hypothetical protein
MSVVTNGNDSSELDWLKPGKESSELDWIKKLTIAAIIIAVASSLGKVPFTPDQVSEYLGKVMAEAGEWTKVLLPYATGLAAFYAYLRTSLKKKAMDKQLIPK